jgi:hypothetical protein
MKSMSFWKVGSCCRVAFLNKHFQDFIKLEDDLDYQTETLMQILSAAENISVPRKLLRMKGSKWKAFPEVLVLLKNCKDTYKEWQKIGKPTDHELTISLKIGKKKLRCKIRMEQAMDRQNLYQQIMDNPNTPITTSFGVNCSGTTLLSSI